MSALYIHVPFCARACPYCDFDFEVDRAPDADAFLAALAREADLRVAEHAGTAFDTVYVGGGTPSVLGPSGLARLLAWIHGRFDTRACQELTVELNPEHTDDATVATLVEHGCDRVSLGVQSFDEGGLRQLGRAHAARDAIAAIERAHAAGLRTSIDLIVGWPGQTASVLRADLAQTDALALRHVSVYALTIEAGSAWPLLVGKGTRRLPRADLQAELLERSEAALASFGLEHYEIASYAAAGARSRHNAAYWSWRDYLGLGPSAASARYEADGAVVRRTNRRGLARWAADVGAVDLAERLAPEEAAAEGAWLGLRRLDGFEIAELLARFPAIDEAWLRRRAARQLAAGALELRDGRLRVAPGRWLQHDAIAADLLS
jgi:oxygen-independent coproporphyrinogen-3 oxidase